MANASLVFGEFLDGYEAQTRDFRHLFRSDTIIQRSKCNFVVPLPDARIVGTAEIPNYQLLFKGSKTGSYLTIEPKQGCTVPAAVWSVSERDELALDRYEGYPHFYYKTELELPIAETGKKLTAFVYIMHEERKLGIPTSAYIRTCVDGYRQFGFDLKHLRKAMDISEREVYHHENG